MRRMQELLGIMVLGTAVIGVGVARAQDDVTVPPPPQDSVNNENTPDPPEVVDTTPAADSQRITALAQAYGVPEATVTSMRTSGMGWGEMETAMDLAKAVAGEGGAVDASLQDILAARQAGAGWGELAQRYGFKLGELKGEGHARKAGGDDVGVGERAAAGVRDLNRDRTRGRDRDRSNRSEGDVTDDRPGRGSRGGSGEARSGKPERAARPEKPERPETSRKPDR